ncbi:hypothetical protein NIES4071_109610 (plasmid) [Calothrix sp. NIES-4071]|nr:hypothetical protein NIES4071_109610 [Calothrix sp. NIES-4071]BAZ65231.1 hypothetical protein NIES4105_109640 [Calothrix sp. NIES-4105]
MKTAFGRIVQAVQSVLIVGSKNFKLGVHMKINTKYIDYFTMTCGISGLIGIAIGTTAITASTVALRTNPFNVIQTQEPLIRKAAKYGYLSLGSGLFAFGLGVGVAKYAADKLSDPELEQEFRGISEDEARYLDLTQKCKGCKYFHGQCYGKDDTDLICAIHPEGVEESVCPDYE